MGRREEVRGGEEKGYDFCVMYLPGLVREVTIC